MMEPEYHMMFIDSIKTMLNKRTIDYLEEQPPLVLKESLTVPEQKAQYRKNLRQMMNKGKKW